MKKILLTSFCIALCGVFAYAQDINDAIKMYNDAALALNNKDYVAALEGAKAALEVAKASDTEDAAEIIGNIENLIPKITYSEAIQLATDKQYDRAIPALQKTIELATAYKNDEIKQSAADLIPQLLLGQANALLSSEKYAEAIEAYNKVLANDPKDETAYLRIGQAQAKLGNETEAVAAYEKARELGSADATKLLSTLFLNKAITANSAKKWDDVLVNAEKTLTYDADNTTAPKLLEMANYNIAVEYDKKGNKAKACEAFKKIANSTNAQIKTYAEARVKELCK